MCTCHVKYRLESKTEAADFRWIVHLNAITDQSYALPVFSCKSCVVVSVKRWALFEHFNKRYMRESSVALGRDLYLFVVPPNATCVVMLKGLGHAILGNFV